VDVLYYGDEFHGDDESDNDQPYAGSGWFGRLPLAWYTESWAFEWRGSAATVTVDSTASSDAVGRSSAPVVVALGDRTDDGVVCEAPRIEEHLSGYHEYCGQRYLYDSGSVSTVLVYVDTDRIDDPAGAYRGVVGGDDPGSGNRSAAGA
jgi:predicted membrane-bound mannosyltransferase